MSRYQFALLRYVHDPVAGEFANIGVVLFDVDGERLLVRTSERYRRITEFFRTLNNTAYRTMVRHVERSLADIDERLRQRDALFPVPETLEEALAAVFVDPESCIRPSPIMYGVQENVEGRFEELFVEFVSQYDNFVERDRRDEEDVRRAFDRELVRAGLAQRVQYGYPINAPNYRYQFHAGWMNGRPQVMEPISLDLVDGTRIVDKANLWHGRLASLAQGNDFGFTAVVAPPADPTLERGFEKALRILRSHPIVRAVVTESHADRAIGMIRDDVADHTS